MAGEENVLGLDDTLTLLNVSKPTLYRLIDRGVITPLPRPEHLKKRAQVRFMRDDVEVARRKILGLPAQQGE